MNNAKDLSEVLRLLKIEIDKEILELRQKEEEFKRQQDENVQLNNEIKNQELEIKKHELEIRQKQMEIQRLLQEITAKKKKISDNTRNKPRLEEEIRKLHHQSETNHQKLAATQHAYADESRKLGTKLPDKQ